MELGWVSDEPSAAEWIHGLLVRALGTLDAPVFLRLHAAWKRDDLGDRSALERLSLRRPRDAASCRMKIAAWAAPWRARW